ncbi:hypothetical protein A5699_04665 [Mycobacterium sp. E802]|nr:hypothetical protein A5699_04665 [Mycobacterium sp. E802]
MVRRGQQGRHELRKAQREASRQIESSQGQYDAKQMRRRCGPPRQWESPYDEANTVRLQFFLWRFNGRLADFVINVQVLTSEGWETVEYFDCCHGHCHLHTQNGEVPRSFVRLDSIDDVQLAFAQVEGESHTRARIIRAEGP